MKLDDELKERLHAVADQVSVGDPEVRRFVRRGRRRSRTKVAGIAASVVVLLAGAGILGSYVMRPTTTMQASPEVMHGVGQFVAGSPRTAQADSEEGRQVFGALRETEYALGHEVQNQRVAPAPSPAPVRGPGGPDPAGGPDEITGIGERIVKTGRIELEVPEGEFQERFADARSVATRYRGFVTASATEGEDARTGRVVIRVPVARFEAALNDLSRLGVLRAEEVRGADVTEEFVDLQGRLKIHKSRQAFLYRKLDETNSIGQSIHLHGLLEEVQFDIEDLRGQLRLLRDQSNFGTIDVSMFEVGAPPVDGGPNEGESPLASAWDRAWHGFQTVLAAIVVGLGYLLPVLVLLVLLWIGVRQVRARTA